MRFETPAGRGLPRPSHIIRATQAPWLATTREGLQVWHAQTAQHAFSGAVGSLRASRARGGGGRAAARGSPAAGRPWPPPGAPSQGMSACASSTAARGWGRVGADATAGSGPQDTPLLGCAARRSSPAGLHDAKQRQQGTPASRQRGAYRCSTAAAAPARTLSFLCLSFLCLCFLCLWRRSLPVGTGACGTLWWCSGGVMVPQSERTRRAARCPRQWWSPSCSAPGITPAAAPQPGHPLVSLPEDGDGDLLCLPIAAPWRDLRNLRVPPAAAAFAGVVCGASSPSYVTAQGFYTIRSMQHAVAARGSTSGAAPRRAPCRTAPKRSAPARPRSHLLWQYQQHV